MAGKIKSIKRYVWYTESSETHWSSDVHPLRHTATKAILYDGEEVFIDEEDIRNSYGCKRITDKTINTLDKDLHNVHVNYSKGDYGKNWLNGNIKDYTKQNDQNKNSKQ